MEGTHEQTAQLQRLAPVAKAIDALVVGGHGGQDAPDLKTLAGYAGLSPSHFQRLFTEGVGVSPKRFLQSLTACKAKAALRAGASVEAASDAAGLSGASRLHDLMLVSEAMTPGRFRARGEGLTIRYAVVEGPLGACLIGATEQGICWLSFASEIGGLENAAAQMRDDWRAADFIEDHGAITPLAQQAFAFAKGQSLRQPLALHVRGTNFQLKVWEALLRIPPGATVSYGDIAREVCTVRASRAVGSAVGANLVSLLIPCHRVLRASGTVNNYRWGRARKEALLAMEDAVFNTDMA